MESFHPAVRRWFEDRFDGPTAPQRDAWPAIAAGLHTLIAAPTGSGKTLAAFLAAIDALARRAAAGELDDRTHVVYVSPLKALVGNDIRIENLEGPLAEIRSPPARRERAAAIRTAPELRVALVRSGDTAARRSAPP